MDKLHKPKRKEAMTELLKNGLGHLQCYRHPKLLLGVFHSKPKCQNYLPSKLLSLSVIPGKVRSTKFFTIIVCFCLFHLCFDFCNNNNFRFIQVHNSYKTRKSTFHPVLTFFTKLDFDKKNKIEKNIHNW